jgi:hypothetical protein
VLGHCSAWLVHALGTWGMQSPCQGTASARGAVSSPTAHQQMNNDEVDGKSIYKDQGTHCYTRTSKGMVAAGFSPERSSARWNSVVEEKEMALKGSGMASFCCTGKRKT